MDRILNEIGATIRIRDPIFGFIRVTKEELRIIDSPLFQRLRRVHQLAFTKYVYPSAEHSRFVHSLGVLHTATAMFAAVVNNPKTHFDRNRHNILSHTQLLRFAALLHDIGHIPFSHAAEEIWLKSFKHEDISCHIINNYPIIKNTIENKEIVPSVVASLLTDEFKPQHKLIHEIISGQLDADRADYLLRDSYCCGVRYGEYDFERYINMFMASGEGDSFRLTIDEKDIHVAEAFLIARYHYNMQVPYHRTRSGFDIALEVFLNSPSACDSSNDWYTKDASGSLTEIDFDKFENLDDNYLIEQIKNGYKRGDFWAKCLLRQEHLKLVMDETNNINEGKELLRTFAQKLESKGLVRGEEFFLLRKDVPIIKQSDVFVNHNQSFEGTHGPIGDPNTILVRSRSSKANASGLADIKELSWIFHHFTVKPPKILRIYVLPKDEKDAIKIRDELLRGV